MITVEYIKELIENKLNIKDLSITSRKRDIVEARFIAFQLSRKYTRHSLTHIGKVFKKDHASVLHGIKKFNDLRFQLEFKDSYNLYIHLCDTINEISDSLSSENIFHSYEEIEHHYKLKYNQLVSSNQTLIQAYKDKINNLTSIKEFEEISLLPENDILEFKQRARAFLTMKKTELHYATK